jgi:histone H3/H4
MLECVSEFISFITSEASEICKKNRRKTITPEDIIESLNSLNFENYTEVLKIYLTKYRLYSK